ITLQEIMMRRESEETTKHDDNNITDHLANERTFLAWIRTGLTVFTLGCAIARFGSSNSSSNLISKNVDKKPIISGFILVLCGIGCLLYSFWQFFRIHQQIKIKSTPNLFGPSIALLLLLIALIVVMILLFFV
ncbi:unnamed protein product, partial [Rotaria sp. Silwood1]